MYTMLSDLVASQKKEIDHVFDGHFGWLEKTASAISKRRRVQPEPIVQPEMVIVAPETQKENVIPLKIAEKKTEKKKKTKKKGKPTKKERILKLLGNVDVDALEQAPQRITRSRRRDIQKDEPVKVVRKTRSRKAKKDVDSEPLEKVDAVFDAAVENIVPISIEESEQPVEEIQKGFQPVKEPVEKPIVQEVLPCDIKTLVEDDIVDCSPVLEEKEAVQEDIIIEDTPNAEAVTREKISSVPEHLPSPPKTSPVKLPLPYQEKLQVIDLASDQSTDSPLKSNEEEQTLPQLEPKAPSPSSQVQNAKQPDLKARKAYEESQQQVTMKMEQPLLFRKSIKKEPLSDENSRRFRPFSKKPLSRLRQKKTTVSEKSLLSVAMKPPVLSSQGQAALRTAKERKSRADSPKSQFPKDDILSILSPIQKSVPTPKSTFLDKISREVGLAQSAKSSSQLGAFLDSHAIVMTPRKDPKPAKNVVTDFSMWMQANKIMETPKTNKMSNSTAESFGKLSHSDPDTSEPIMTPVKEVPQSVPEEPSIEIIRVEESSPSLEHPIEQINPIEPLKKSTPIETPVTREQLKPLSVWQMKKKQFETQRDKSRSDSEKSDKSRPVSEKSEKIQEPKNVAKISSLVDDTGTLSNLSKSTFTMIPKTQQEAPKQRPKEAIKALEIAKKKREEDERRHQLKEKERMDARRRIEERKQARNLMQNKKPPVPVLKKQLLKPRPNAHTKPKIMKTMVSQNYMQSNKSGMKRKMEEVNQVIIPDEPIDSEDELSDHYEKALVPQWADSSALKQALRVQDLDKASSIFNDIPTSCDLTDMFAEYPEKKRYKRRTSSAHWTRPPLRH